MIIHKQLMIDQVLQNLEGHNLTKNIKVLILFDDMIPDIEANKKLSLLVSLICSSEERNSIIQFLLYHNLISKSLKL